MRRFGVLGVCVLSMAVGAIAQGGGAGMQPGALPTSVAAEVNGFYTRIAGFITRSAELVPVEKYTWQPTPDVRTYARLFGHISDDNNGACWSLAGLSAAPPRLDTMDNNDSPANKMSKADLVKALSDSVELCQKAFAAVTPANMMEASSSRGRTKVGILIYNTSHINEHYGNLVTYLRLNGMTPPSSAGRGRG